MRYVDRAGRKDQIYAVLSAVNRSMTVREVAHCLHLSVSTHLRKIMNEMVEDKELFKVEAQHRPNAVKVLYSVNDFSQNSVQGRLF